MALITFLIAVGSAAVMDSQHAHKCVDAIGELSTDGQAAGANKGAEGANTRAMFEVPALPPDACWSQVPRLALKTPFRGGTVQDLAKTVRLFFLCLAALCVNTMPRQPCSFCPAVSPAPSAAAGAGHLQGRAAAAGEGGDQVSAAAGGHRG